MENQHLVSPLRQCSSILVSCDERFLSKEQLTTLDHRPYSPDLAAADFYLFPQLKSALTGWHVCDATDIMKNAVEELKRLAQNWFQECFQHLYS